MALIVSAASRVYHAAVEGFAQIGCPTAFGRRVKRLAGVLDHWLTGSGINLDARHAVISGR
jgi:hypothetical protein